MKKIVTLMTAVAALCATSCQKAETETGALTHSGSTDIAIKAELPHAMAAYGAASASSDKGGAGNVDPAEYDLRYIMEVWSTGDNRQMVYRDIKCVDDWSASAAVTFNARLLAKKYDFTFWADFVDKASQADKHYAAASLDNVAFNGAYQINNDARDAYWGRQTVDLTQQGAAIGGIKLRRPFGKIRFISTDKAVNSTDAPTEVTVIYGDDNLLYKAFNAVDGVACGTKSALGELSCTAVQEGDDSYLLACDYILASDDITSLSGVKVQIQVGSEVFVKSLPEIPVAANKLTTVKGNFYTNEGKLTVSVEDDFAGSEDKSVPNEVNVTSIEAVSTAITEAASNNAGNAVKVVVADKVAGSDAAVAIPAEVTVATTPEITLDLSAGIDTGKKVTIGGDGGETAYNGVINVVVPAENEGNLEIKAPNAHVTINGKYNVVTAQTSASTLVIDKETTVATLNVEAGNVEVYGTVNAFGTIATGSKIFWGAGTAEALREALAMPAAQNHGVILTADITSVTPEPNNGNQDNQDAFRIGTPDNRSDFYAPTDYDGYVLDGNGFSISGAAYNNLLAVYAHNAEVKNLMLYQTAENRATKKNCGVSVYRSKNVELNNLTISDCGKTGVIINAATATATDLSVSDCGWGGVNVAKGENPAGGEKPQFTLVSGSFKTAEGTYAIYVDSNTAGDYAVTVPASWYEADLMGIKVYSPSPVSSVYDGAKITELIAAATDNDVITLPAGIYTVNSTIEVNKPLTIKGNGAEIRISGDAGFDVQKNLTLNNVTLECDTPAGKAPVKITKPGVQFSADKLLLNQNGKGTGDGNEVAKHSMGIWVVSSPDVDNVKVTLTNSAINLNAPSMQMGVVLGATDEGQSGLELDMANSTITSYPAENQNSGRTFGVHVGEVTGAKVALKNCRIEGMHYPVRCRDVVTKSTLELLVDNTVLTGYSALTIRGKTDITVQNGSVLTGRNYYSNDSSYWATIMFQASSENSTLTVDNSTITNIVTGTCDEDLIRMDRLEGIVVTLKNYAKLIDDPNASHPLPGAVFKDLTTTSTVTADETVQLIGKEGFKLMYQ